MPSLLDRLFARLDPRSQTPEVYISECCGVAFVPGSGPDDLHETDAPIYDAQRHGDCPACGHAFPMLTELDC